MSPGLTKFDAFELDTGQRLLRRDGAEVHLTPKAFDLLVLLIEHAPRVVAKKSCIERCGRRRSSPTQLSSA